MTTAAASPGSSREGHHGAKGRDGGGACGGTAWFDRRDPSAMTGSITPPPEPAEATPRAASSRRRPRWFLWFMVLGPGLIAANAGNDAGGIATYP